MLVEAERQLAEYFRGPAQGNSRVELDFVGTPFQKEVWRALLDIPFGETRTYAGAGPAGRQPVGRPGRGARANGKNPISIIAPCHRVIGTSGKLTGFAGGLEAKAFLLRLEGAEVGEKA